VVAPQTHSNPAQQAKIAFDFVLALKEAEALGIGAWQDRLDAAFPHGLIATWDVPRGSSQRGICYQIPRAEVIAQAGMDPVVALPVFGIDKLLVMRVRTYDVRQRQPCLVARVTRDDPPPMFWSAGVGRVLATRMADQRREFTDWSAAQGQSIFA
jgi:hypothetical protein